MIDAKIEQTDTIEPNEQQHRAELDPEAFVLSTLFAQCKLSGSV